jgi:hypothetical protein
MLRGLENAAGPARKIKSCEIENEKWVAREIGLKSDQAVEKKKKIVFKFIKGFLFRSGCEIETVVERNGKQAR